MYRMNETKFFFWNFRSNAHQFQLQSKKIDVWWAFRYYAELKLLSRTYTQRDYEYSTVDSCLKILCDAMENLLTFFLLALWRLVLSSSNSYYAMRISPPLHPQYKYFDGVGVALLQYLLPVAELYMFQFSLSPKTNYNILFSSEVELAWCLYRSFFIAKHERAKFLII